MSGMQKALPGGVGGAPSLWLTPDVLSLWLCGLHWSTGTLRQLWVGWRERWASAIAGHSLFCWPNTRELCIIPVGPSKWRRRRKWKERGKKAERNECRMVEVSKCWAGIRTWRKTQRFSKNLLKEAFPRWLYIRGRCREWKSPQSTRMVCNLPPSGVELPPPPLLLLYSEYLVA